MTNSTLRAGSCVKRSLLSVVALAVALGGATALLEPQTPGHGVAVARQDADTTGDDENLDQGTVTPTDEGPADDEEPLDNGPVATADDLTPPPSDANIPPPAVQTAAQAPAPVADTSVPASNGSTYVAPQPVYNPWPFTPGKKRGMVVSAGAPGGVPSSADASNCDQQVTNGVGIVGLHCGDDAGSGFFFDANMVAAFLASHPEFDSFVQAQGIWVPTAGWVNQIANGDTSGNPANPATSSGDGSSNSSNNRKAAASSDTKISPANQPVVQGDADVQQVGDTTVVTGKDTGLTRTRTIFRNAGQTIERNEGGDNNVTTSKQSANANNDKNGKNNKHKDKNKNKNKNKKDNKHKNKQGDKNGKHKNQKNTNNDTGKNKKKDKQDKSAAKSQSEATVTSKVAKPADKAKAQAERKAKKKEQRKTERKQERRANKAKSAGNN